MRNNNWRTAGAGDHYSPSHETAPQPFYYLQKGLSRNSLGKRLNCISKAFGSEPGFLRQFISRCPILNLSLINRKQGRDERDGKKKANVYTDAHSHAGNPFCIFIVEEQAGNAPHIIRR
jgi:hypothetical protein